MIDTLAHWWHSLIDAVGAAHPAWLFLAIAFLPLVGMPASPLLVAAGIRLGTVAGFALVLGALVVNLTAGYWLARRWMRAPLTRWLERRGYKIPQLAAEDETQFILLFRVTPGVPLFAQNYLLGLAGVSFRRYLLLSLPVQAAYALAFVWFGQSLNSSATWKVMVGVGALVALVLAVNLLRRWLAHRKAGAASAVSRNAADKE
ncbi:MAG TPA: VTT domain-containing protein [Candidatus Limnocylindria bacterium]|jgi:uncharacterized membrane protein YdjX (TVP38/TMEM64 family)|nr:VTT domain-containing protein [Candidatus Limnocylindria bacterium]